VETDLRSGLRRAALLTASTAAKELYTPTQESPWRSYATNPASICEVPFYAFAKAVAKVIPCREMALQCRRTLWLTTKSIRVRNGG
jgi:hypothetical protein